MKTVRIMMAIAAIAAMPMLFTSCDDDPDYWYDDWAWGRDYNYRPNDGNVDDQDFLIAMAQTLNGQWRGSMRAYRLNGQRQAIDSVDYSTDIEFVQYNSSAISGTGTQHDYDPYTGIKQYQRDFTWYIDPKTGDIYLTYKSQEQDGSYSDYVMRINYDDLNLNNRSFTGYLWSSDATELDDFWFDRYSNGTRATRSAGSKATKWEVVMRAKK